MSCPGCCRDLMERPDAHLPPRARRGGPARVALVVTCIDDRRPRSPPRPWWNSSNSRGSTSADRAGRSGCPRVSVRRDRRQRSPWRGHGQGRSPSEKSWGATTWWRSEEHTSELQSRQYLVCRLLLEKKNNTHYGHLTILEPATGSLCNAFHATLLDTLSLSRTPPCTTPITLTSIMPSSSSTKSNLTY